MIYSSSAELLNVIFSFCPALYLFRMFIEPQPLIFLIVVQLIASLLILVSLGFAV